MLEINGDKINEVSRLINELANDKEFQNLIEKAKNKDIDDLNDEECLALKLNIIMHLF